MNILVTGGNGFIGANLVDTLAAEGHDVSVFDLYPRVYESKHGNVGFIQGNLEDANLIRQVITDRGIDVVYHLAWATIHETAVRNPRADVELNLVPTINLLDICREVEIKQFVFLSSGGTVYGIPGKLPVKEDAPTQPINPYGITKLAAEKYIQMYGHLYGLNYTIFRPSVPYGPFQNPRRRQGAVMVFLYKALKGEPVTIWGNGDVLRDYFYIDDLSQALSMALRLPSGSNPILNLSGDQAYTLNQLVDLIEKNLHLKIQVHYEPERKFDVPQLHLDCQAARDILGWNPQVSISEGICRTAEWLRGEVP